MKIRDFEKFLEEITIKGNPAIPGEGGKKDGESQYLKDVEKRAKERLGITGAQSYPELGGRLMSLLSKSNQYIKDEKTKDELVRLANKVIIETYGWILDRYEIELDIQFVKPAQIKPFMEECEDCQPEAEVEFKEVTDEDILREVHKRKIANLIIQGEAKNTKHILHSETVKSGLNRIYGDEKAEEIFKIWDEMTKIADKLDWIIPTEARSKAMEVNPDGFAGACGFGWKKTEKEEEEIEIEDEEEYTEWTGDMDEEDMYSEENYEDFDTQEELNFTPILRARGVDFPMLLHETVKGLFELLSLGGIPSDPRSARVVVSETGMSDEPEDWKFGPEIARDFRDFVNKNPKVNEYPNVKEELFKMMIDKDTMPTEEFLELFRGILSNKPFARRKLDQMIDDVIEKIEELQAYYDDLERYEKEMEEYNREMEEYNRKMSDWGKRQGSRVQEPEEDFESELDYSELSKREIQDLIDDALDQGDFDTVRKLTPYLKEGKEIYLREIESILENKKRSKR